MPLFEYECKDCGEKSEILVFGSDAQPNCQKCGSENLKKLLSAHSSLSGASKSSISNNIPACCGSEEGKAACPSAGSCPAALGG